MIFITMLNKMSKELSKILRLEDETIKVLKRFQRRFVIILPS